MLASELQNRLEHLVTYSSQLIFVSGESIGQQQSTIQSFLASQHESTEIAFINADPAKQDLSYRKEIIRQLLGKVSGSFEQSLSQLVTDVTQLPSPAMVCISAADNCSDKLLQELWELVIRCRNSRKAVHLNVLMFGDLEWANHAKQLLSEGQTDKPVLLSSEVIKPTEISGSELEDLIAKKRQQFDQRIRQRSAPTIRELAVVQTLWFKLLMFAVFLIAFMAIFLWQYQDQWRQWLETSKNSPLSQTEVAVKPQSPVGDEPEMISEQANSGDEQQDQQPQVIDVDDASEQALVTSWQSEMTKLKEAELVHDQDMSQVVEDAVVASEPDINLPPDGSNEVQSTATSAAINPPHPLMAIEKSRFVIQLSAMADPNLLARFIRQHGLDGQVWQYQTQRFGGDWHVLIFRQSYDSVAQAKESISNLVDEYGITPPFVKAIEQVQEEISIE